MPHDARRHAAPRIRRVASLAGVLALVGALTSVPGGPGPGGAAAAAPAARMATHASKLANAGPVSLRALARRGTVGRVAAPSIPARLAWQRPGRSGLGNGGGASEPGAGPGRAGDAAASPGAAPGPAGDAAASPGAGPGPGVVGDSAAAPAAAAAAAGGPGVVGTAWTGPTDQAIDCGSSRPCLEPPDPWVAVSSTHVVQMVNPVTRITNRTGGGATQVANSAFFNVAAWSTTAFASDPRVLYDPAHDRWVATLFAGTCSGGALFVAVSDTGDPTGTWQRYFKAFNGIWPDFPTLGYSSALVAIGVNEFGVSCGTGGTSIVGAYQGASLHVMDWADLLDGGGTPTISSTSPTPSAFTYVPAAGLTAGSALHAAVALDDGSSKTASLGYLSVSGTLAGGDLLVASPVDLTTLPLAKLQQPPTPVDAGGLIGVQGNALDLRPTDAVWRDGRLAVASTTSCLRGTTYRPCGRIIELATQADLSAPTLRQDLLISPTSGYSDTFTPGVGYSDDGSLWTVFSQSSSARYVSSWARRQLPAAAPGAWSAGSALVAAGRGPYGGIAGAGLNQRWGDYVGVARDPAEPGSVWQANQAADTGGGWMTRVARLGDDVTPPGTGVTRPRFISGTTAGRTSIPLSITWATTDPGSGVASVQLQRSINGGSWTTIASSSAGAGSATVTVGYGARYAFRVMAVDNAGNAAAWSTATSFTPAIVSDGSSVVAYRGTWVRTSGAAYLGGGSRFASSAGRRATVTFSGLAVAWVSVAARTRGSARVYGDGALQGTYSTYRSATAYRRVISNMTFAALGRHTYRIEVVGSAGHPRVDLDAFIVLR